MLTGVPVPPFPPFVEIVPFNPKVPFAPNVAFVPAIVAIVPIWPFVPTPKPQPGMLTHRRLLHSSQLPQSKLLKQPRRDELVQVLSWRQRPPTHCSHVPQSKLLKHARRELLELDVPQFEMFTHWLFEQRRQVPHCASVVHVALQFRRSTQRLLEHTRQVPHCASVVHATTDDDDDDLDVDELLAVWL